jgi:hypothetical protein
MPLRWKLFRLVCVLQILLTLAHSGFSLINTMVSGSFMHDLLNALAYICMLMLSNLGLHLVNNNYPNEPVIDAQKIRFNWLFLINFFLLAFSSGHVFAEYRQLSELAETTGSFSSLPGSVYIPFLVYLVIFIFHIYILYGLFQLRRELYSNYMKNQFEFEKQSK